MLTGKTRLRTTRLSYRHEALVLQVEEPNSDFLYSPSPTLWRDATTEDLAELSSMQANAPWNAKKETS